MTPKKKPVRKRASAAQKEQAKRIFERVQSERNTWRDRAESAEACLKMSEIVNKGLSEQLAAYRSRPLLSIACERVRAKWRALASQEEQK